jgi:uncharacterized protein (TIGR03437 family)
MIVCILPQNLTPTAQSGSYAQIQITNSSVASNVVTAFVNNTTPGVLTQAENGVGPSLAMDSNVLVTESAPAMIGDTVTLYVTGLGMATSPAGIASISGEYAPANQITATIGGVPAVVSFPNLPATMTPSVTGLNLMNVKVPAGVPSGSATIMLSGPDSQASQATIWVP